MKKLMKFISLIVALSMILALFTGCSSSSDSDEDASSDDSSSLATNSDGRDDLVIALASEPVSLDLNRHAEGYGPLVCAQIGETLIQYNEDNEIECVLAESYEVVDDTTIKFYLREGVLFHNGEEMKASDVVYTFYRVSLDTEVQSTCAYIDFDSCYAEDDYTFVLKLYEPYAAIFSILTLNYFTVVSEKYITEIGEDQVDYLPCGTGPYKFVSWDIGESIVVERFDDYWDADNAAKTSQITFRFVTESASRTIELETGGVDIALSVSASDTDLLDAEEGITVHAGAALGYTMLIFGNSGNEALQDPTVRLALMKATDRESIASTVMGSYAEVCNSVIGLTSYGYTDEYAAENWGYDVEAAKELLEEAGASDIEIDIMITDSTTNTTIAEMLKNMWEQIGVSVSISIYESGTYYDYFGAGEYDCVIANWDTALIDPDDTLTVMFTSDGMGLYTDDTCSELIQAQRGEMDEEARLEIIEEVQVYLQEQVAVLPLYSGSIISAYNSDLTNMPAASSMNNNARFADISWS